jgi:hypothetical protein
VKQAASVTRIREVARLDILEEVSLICDSRELRKLQICEILQNLLWSMNPVRIETDAWLAHRNRKIQVTARRKDTRKLTCGLPCPFGIQGVTIAPQAYVLRYVQA